MIQTHSNGLTIAKDQFEELYGDAVSYEAFSREPLNDEDYVSTFLSSKLWRLNNLYTFIDKDGERGIFKMNLAQHRVYAKSLIHPRLIILKSRQQGISTFWLISFLDDTLFIDDLNVGMMAQGLAESSTLLKRTKLAWGTFPPEVREFLNLSKVNDNSQEVTFNNNSTLFIRTSFRSTTLQRLHISEFGKIAAKTPERAQETKTGTLQAIKPGNLVVIESTAEGDNEFKLMWDNAVEAELKPELAPKDFMPVFLSWLDDPDCVSYVEEAIDTQAAVYFDELEEDLGFKLTQEQKNFWIGQYRELGDAIYQEYPATAEEAFAKVKDGAYYSKLFLKHVQKKKRVVKRLYDENLDVHVAMDLGVNDTFTLVFFQVWRGEWRVIGEYTNSGEGLEHYVNHIKECNYHIGTIICPHDIKVTELGTGLSRLVVLKNLLKEYLISCVVKVLPRLPIVDGIEAFRRVIPNLWVDSKCKYLIGCAKNYTKEWDEKLGVWKSSPSHDKWSHGADALRYMALSRIRATANRLAKGGRDRYAVVDGLAM